MPTTGRVQVYFSDRNWGFVIGDDDTRYFAHAKQVETGQPLLAAGQRVEFTIQPHPKGPRAIQIRVLGGPADSTTARTPPVAPPHPNASPRAAPITTSPRIMPANPGHSAATPPPVMDRAAPSHTHSNEDVGRVAQMLGAFMGVGTELPSFALGNATARAPAFRAAAAELHLRASGRPVHADTSGLPVAVAEFLRAHGISREPQLTAKLRTLETVLSPLLRLVVSPARPEIHRAMLEHFTTAVRTAVLKPLPPRRPPPPPAPEPKAATAPPSPGAPASGPSESSAPSLSQLVGQHRRDVLEPRIQHVQKLLQDLQAVRNDFHATPMEHGTAAQLVRSLGEVQAGAEQAIAAAAELIASNQEGATRHLSAIEKLHTLFRSEGLNGLPPELLSELARPQDAERIASLMSAAAHSTSSVPAWLLTRWFGDATSLLDRVGLLLKRSTLHGEVVGVVEWVDSLPTASRQLLPQCAAPPPGSSVLDTLKETLEALLEQQRDDGQWKARLGSLKGLASETLLERLMAERNATTEALLSRTEGLARRVQLLEASLGPAAFGELREALRAWPENPVPDTLNSVEFAVERLEPELSRVQPSLAALLGLARKLRQPEVAPASPAPQDHKAPEPTPPEPGASIEHPLSRVQNNRTYTYSASLAWVAIPNQGYGVLRFPVRLKFDQAVERAAEWLVEFSTDLLNTIPAEWRRQYLTVLPLQVPVGASYRDFTVEVPVTAHNADLIAKERRNITLQFTASRGPQRITGSLHWQGLQRELPKYVSPLPITATRREMDRHPLGVEREFTRLCDLVTGGRKSFRVHGPRRMGKTTVIRALREHFAQSPHVFVLESVVASQYQTAAEVWEAVAQRLSQAFNRPVNLGKVLPPPEEAFDAVREAAREKGYSTIYVLLDEAQALFTLSSDPRRLGEALKARLESAWAQPSDTRATLLLGLVGQAHLPELMGANLLGAISDAVTADGIRADELNQLLRMTQGEIGLQSTTEAREVLARQAGNLWILGSLLDRIATTCLQEGRPWFTVEDVERAVQRLVEADDAGTETTLWSYVRDVLNESDDKNVWRPSEAFPVAMAWAHVRALGGELPKLRVEKVDFIHLTLQDWSRSSDIQKQRVEDAFALLQRQRVLRKDDSFDLPLLERLLLARANGPEPFADETDRRSLNRLGLRRLVAPPASGTENTQGGQASVYEGIFDGKAAAVRRVRLTDSKAEQRFIREVSLLERLNGASGDAVREAQAHLPRLFGTGIDLSAPEVGLVVYEWVVGTPLEAHQLTANGALLVLQGLTRALAALRHCGIVHRDIRPANVLIRRNKSEPVLIDFGLSVAVDQIARTTALAGVVEFLPAEVREMGASAWSHAGDMYSVGRTLAESLAVPAASDTDVMGILQWMMRPVPAERPSPQAVLERIDALISARQVQQRMVELRQRFTDALSGLAPALREAAQGSLVDFVAAQSGIATPKLRLLRASEFLENLVQAKVRLDYPAVAEMMDGPPARTFLKAISEYRPKLPAGLRPLADCESAHTVGELRNAAAHGAQAELIIGRAHRQLPASIRKGSPLDDAAQRAFRTAIENVSDTVATLLSRPAVRQLIREWLTS
ncbi:protein kinase domain-containing protein [Myxococcus landrumensis]|uniref:Cold shock domain-containing protein n=1 Tax=Myxococcus landrumensis TaxID=2813577 RepID=A0ABX7NLL2_9BACT|nr:AAA family ATPase [Myxococcus landrumus]QSQ17153.1 cold shock domain-containing protein [Myxococcus landrumus]